MKSKIKSCIVSAIDGDAFWQPGIKGNCITIKVSPWNVEKTQHTIFLHELPKGGKIPVHSHDENEEIFICLEGEAKITIDDNEYLFTKHDIAFLAPHSTHCIRTISDTPLKLMVIISPTGLEERLKLMGIPKEGHDTTPPVSFDSEIGKNNTHGVIRNINKNY